MLLLLLLLLPQVLANSSVSSGVGVYWMFYSGGDFEAVPAPAGLPGVAAGAAVEGLRMRPGLAMSQVRSWTTDVPQSTAVGLSCMQIRNMCCCPRLDILWLLLARKRSLRLGLQLALVCATVMCRQVVWPGIAAPFLLVRESCMLWKKHWLLYIYE